MPSFSAMRVAPGPGVDVADDIGGGVSVTGLVVGVTVGGVNISAVVGDAAGGGRVTV